MAFLEQSTWEGKIYSGGWITGSGGEYDAIEPATGKTLARVGAATAADVHKAAESAAQAQREWAALTYDRRAAVLRRAGDLFVEHEDEIHDWLIRESGAIRPVRTIPDQRCRRRGVLGSSSSGQPSGRRDPAVQPAAAVHGPPVAGRCGRRDRPVQCADHPGDPGHRPRPRAGQRGDLQTRPADRDQRWRRVRQNLRGGRPARRPVPRAARRCRRRCRGGRRPADSGDRVHRFHQGRKDRSPPRRRTGSSGCTWNSAATPR